jgi:hypothetical protein
MKKLAKILDLSNIKNKKWIIIGDIHSCYEQFINLLNKCNYNQEKDIIIATGDLIDRGDRPYDILRFFIETPNTYSVLGNHDSKLMRYLLGNKIKIGNKLRFTIDEISIKCNSDYKQKISNFLNELPHIIKLPDLNNKPMYIVHAGFAPGIPPEKQTKESCLFIRGIDPKNYFDESKGIWYDFLDGTYTVLSGHIVSQIVQPNPSAFCLDGGCCHGGVLRAMIIENDKYEIVEVNGYKMDEKIPETFRVIEGNNGEKLITPEFGVGNESWKNKNLLWLRSLHIDKDDKVISCGFKKFFNINEGPTEFQITEQNILDKKDLVATLKYDGSLLIRYVQDKIVKFRTRGALQVGLDNKNEIDDFIKKYPLLNDSSFCSNLSLLLEWVSPKNQIVIKYNEPDIILVGAIWYNKNLPWYDNEFKLLTLKELKDISVLSGIRLVEYFKLNNQKETIDLIEKLKTEKEIEGYVIRFNSDQELVKIKSNHYFILHTLKSRLSSESIADLWLSWDKPDFETFKNKFEKTYDFETWQTVIPIVSSIYDGITTSNKIFDHIKS